jgi:three-Cys-motif partner protein
MVPAKPLDASPQYWQEYSNLQRVKHELIRNYLGGWFPMLGSWNGRVLYFDTHAGRGKHLAGQYGSPLIALQTLLGHSYLPKLNDCKFQFFFIEIDQKNKAALDAEIAALGTLPNHILVGSHCGDCFEVLQSILAKLREDKHEIAPAFIFVDPYGFKIPGALLRELLAAGRVELFVNVIWRELNMGLAHANKGQIAFIDTMDQIFDGPEWRDRIVSNDPVERADQAIDLLAEKLNAKWVTTIRMLGDNKSTRYVLAHFSNHDAGRDLMKDCMWKVSEVSDGGFYARKDNQQLLITPGTDLSPLREWILKKAKEGVRWRDLHELVRPEIWRPKQVNDVVRELRKQKLLEAKDYEGIFAPKNNPLLVLKSTQTSKSTNKSKGTKKNKGTKKSKGTGKTSSKK